METCIKLPKSCPLILIQISMLNIICFINIKYVLRQTDWHGFYFNNLYVFILVWVFCFCFFLRHANDAPYHENGLYLINFPRNYYSWNQWSVLLLEWIFGARLWRSCFWWWFFEFYCWIPILGIWKFYSATKFMFTAFVNCYRSFFLVKRIIWLIIVLGYFLM